MSSNDIVILAIDGSAFSEKAFNWYADHMFRTGHTVILVNCLELPSIPSRDSWESQTSNAREKVKPLEDKYLSLCADRNIKATFRCDFEKPGVYICNVAKEENASVIVMGTRGLSKIARTILGSVSNYVLNHAPCPVCVVRSDTD